VLQINSYIQIAIEHIPTTKYMSIVKSFITI